MNWLRWFGTKLIALTVFPVVHATAEIIAKAPVCHGKPAEFIGSFTSLVQHRDLYRCNKCGKVFVETERVT